MEQLSDPSVVCACSPAGFTAQTEALDMLMHRVFPEPLIESSLLHTDFDI